MSTLYDEIVYPNSPFPLTQPTRMAVAAALFGVGYAPPQACRVLEIGCGDGGNLIPMAAAWPGSEFVGFDLAASRIAVGAEVVADLGLTNIRLEVLDILDPGDLGRFDYVIAHGVYAWVPPAVQEATMALIARVLQPHGVAFVSYNALPGCRIRQMIRDMLLIRLQGIETPKDRIRVALSFLETLVGCYNESQPRAAAVRSEAMGMLERGPNAFFHDELGACYEPVYVSQFLAQAARHDLHLLADAAAGLIEPVGPNVDSARALLASADDDVRLEQYLDFLNLRAFRQTLLRHGSRGVAQDFESRIKPLHVAANLERDPSGDHRTVAGVKVRTDDPRLAALLDRLTALWPHTLPVAEVDEPLLSDLARLHLREVVELQAAPSPFTVTPGERPRASALARRQAAAGETSLTTLAHGKLEVGDPAGRRFISLLDGRRTRPELAQTMAETLGAPIEAVAASLDGHLERLARVALLEA